MQFKLITAVFVLFLGSVHASCPIVNGYVGVCTTKKCEGIQSTVSDLNQTVSGVQTIAETTTTTASNHEKVISEIKTKLSVVKHLETKVNKLIEKNLELKKKVSAIKEREEPLAVGFSASRKTPSNPIKDSQGVIFNNVWTNIGKNYDPRTGIFTAHHDGMYIFQWTILTDHGNKGDTYLMVNDQPTAKNSADSKTHGSFGFRSGTSAIVLSLKRNDKVWIKAKGVNYIIKQTWSSFHGWLEKKF